MRQAGVTQPIVGGDGYDTPLLLQVGGEAANDVYFTTHAFMAEGSTAGDREVLQGLPGRLRHGAGERLRRSRLRHGRARRRCDHARRLGGPEGIRDALAATQGYAGVTGSISFPPDVRVPDKTVSMIGVKDDKLFLADEVTPSYIPAP